MKFNLKSNLLLTVSLGLPTLLGTAMTTNAQSISFETTRSAGNQVELAIQANGPVTAEGIKGTIVPDGKERAYILTAQNVTIEGDLISFKAESNQITVLTLTDCDNLDEIKIFGNLLTTLDVTKCPALKNLDCSKNQLTELKLTNRSNLEKVDASLNHLVGLDLTGCSNLLRVDVGSNELLSLDVTPCTKLQELVCYKNQISSLSLSECKDLRKLLCQSNNITEFDASQCPGLTYLDIGFNQLKTLDMTSCEHINWFYCGGNLLEELKISNRKELEWMWCFNNKLTSLDLSGCKRLKWAFCFYNKLTSLNLEGCEDLDFLCCESNRLSCDEMDKVVAALPKLPLSREAKLEVVTEEERRAAPGGGNIMTQEAVELAKSKNWMVCFVAEAGSHQFALYNGREGSCHDGKLSFKVTLSPTTNGTVKLVGVEDFENVPYGQVIKVEVTPDKNCELVSLKVNNKDISKSKSFVVNKNMVVTATFRNPANEVVTEKVALYPNPARESVVLNGAAALSEVRLYTVNGELLMVEKADEAGRATLNVAEVPEGKYLVVYQDAADQNHTEQLMVAR